MKTIYIIPVLLIVAACDVPNNPTRSSATGVTEIKLQEGRNCWDNQCMRFNPRNGSFSLSGRESVGPSSGSLQSGGYISVSAFQQTFINANRAASRGGRDR